MLRRLTRLLTSMPHESARGGARVDTVVNVAILFTCVVMSTAVIYRWTVSPTSRAPQLREIKVGDSAEALPGVSYAAPLTLVMYVRSSCHFCTESMSFYHSLTAGRFNDVKIIAVSPEDVSVTQKYLHDHDVVTDQVVSHRGRIGGTPTLVGVDSKGIVRRVWAGAQTTSGEQEIRAALAHPWALSPNKG
jgi:hypothetical protein